MPVVVTNSKKPKSQLTVGEGRTSDVKVSNSNNYGQLGINPNVSVQGSQAQVQTTASPQRAVGGLQTTITPTQLNNSQGQRIGSVGGSVLGAATGGASPTAGGVGGSGGTSGIDVAQINAKRGQIRSIIDQIRGVYNDLYGDLEVVGADRSRAVNERFNKENTALVDEFNAEFPKIGNAFAARNASDSSYRIDRENQAIDDFGNLQSDVARARDEGLQEVGGFIASEQATINADRTNLDNIVKAISESTNEAELLAIQQQLADKVNTLRASRAGLQSRDALQSRANATLDLTDRTTGLRQTLNNIISGAAPTVLKMRVAQQVLSNSGLAPNDQQALLDEFNRQLNGAGEVEQTRTQV